MAPPAPAEMVLPDLEEWVTLLELDDAIGDETGDGDYIYPLASDFATPNDGGLWDARKLTIRQSAWNAQFILEMDEMTDIWGLATGLAIKSYKSMSIRRHQLRLNRDARWGKCSNR